MNGMCYNMTYCKNGLAEMFFPQKGPVVFALLLPDLT